jgi:outer membrane biosynthesis protein TonB
MKTSQTELYSALAILLYIVFLSHSPPRVLRDLLGNVYVAVLVFAAFAYVTLWRSRTIGVLLILAFILTMTRVTEHLDVPVKPTDSETPTETPPTPPTNTPPPLEPPAPSTKPTVDSATVPGMATSTPITPVVAPEATPVTAAAATAPAPAQMAPPATTPPLPPTAPATPPATTTPPAPVMSCNIESFASF